MRKSTRTTTKKQSCRRRYKTKCRRSTRRCVRRRTRKQYGSGKRTIGEAVDEMRERLKQKDRSWYDANVVPAENRSAIRRAEIEAQGRPEAFTAPSIASMGDPEMMRKHIETLDRAEERAMAKADAEVEAEAARQREEEDKYSFKNLYPITRGPTPLFHYADHIMAAEQAPPGSNFRNIFNNEDNQPLKKKRKR